MFKPRVILPALALLLLLAGGLRLMTGPDGLGMPRDSVELSLRGLRAVCAASVGAGLAVAGVLLQCLLRNPLAEPATLGLTTGAGLGVTLSVYAQFLATGAIVQYSPPAFAASAGALGALGVVALLGQRRGIIDPVSLVLVGVVVSLICGAGIVMVQHLLPDRGVALGARWVMGSLSDETTWPWAVGALVLSAGAACLGARFGPALDAASLGQDEALSVGVRLGMIRACLFCGAGVLTAATVLLAGPVGFVGLVAPHLVRLIAGPAHRSLIAGSAMLGATLILAADTGVKMIDLGAGRMPIGVLTAIIGGPVFIALLRREAVER